MEQADAKGHTLQVSTAFHLYIFTDAHNLKQDP